MNTLVHYVIVLDAESREAFEQLDGVAANKKLGSVVPVKAVTGRQEFACCFVDGGGSKAGLCMSKHAGKPFEGANHGGTGDPQFVNCPMCKETKQFQEAMAEHERYTAEDKGLFAHLGRK